MKIKFDKKEIFSFLKSLFINPLFYIIIFLFLIDIVSKWIIQIYVPLKNQIVLIPNLLYVTKIYNQGTIFGLGDNKLWARVILIIIRFSLMIIIPIIYFFKGRDIKKRYKVCLVLIYAGCIGNLVDSLFYWNNPSGVIDWIGIPFFFPNNNYIFNLADSYVTISVILLIIFFIIDEIKEIKEKNRKGAYTLTPEEYEKKLKEEQNKNDNKNN